MLSPSLVSDESGVVISIGVHLKSRQKVLISDTDTWNIQMKYCFKCAHCSIIECYM